MGKSKQPEDEGERLYNKAVRRAKGVMRDFGDDDPDEDLARSITAAVSDVYETQAEKVAAETAKGLEDIYNRNSGIRDILDGLLLDLELLKNSLDSGRKFTIGSLVEVIEALYTDAGTTLADIESKRQRRSR